MPPILKPHAKGDNDLIIPLTNNKHRIAGACALLMFGLSACAAPPVARQAVPAQQTVAPAASPVNVAKQFYALIQNKQVNEAMALAAEDYTSFDISTRGKLDKKTGTKAWQSAIDAGLTFEETDFKDADGLGRVTSCYIVRQSDAVVDQGCDNVTHVRDGKIIFDGLERDENVWIVQRYYDAVNRGDIDTAAMFIADAAMFINPTGSYKNKAEIVASLQAQAKDGLTFELSNFREKDGRVVYDYIVKAKGDILDTGTDGLTKVKAGKIIFDGTEKSEPVRS